MHVKLIAGALVALASTSSPQDLFDGPLIELPGVERPDVLLSGDLNGDGHVDMMSAQFDSARLEIILGDGLFGFEAAATLEPAMGGSPQLADLDGDGDLELLYVATVASAPAVEIYDIALDGTTTLLDTITTDLSGGVARIAVGDANGDGVPDVALARDMQIRAEISHGLGDGTFGPPQQVVTLFQTFVAGIVDVDADGAADLLLDDLFAGNVIWIVRGDGAGGYLEPELFLEDVSSVSSVESITAPGAIDLFVVEPPSKLRLITWTPGVGVTGDQDLKDLGQLVDVTDVDGDGLADVVGFDDKGPSPVSDGQLFIRLQEPGGTFGPRIAAPSSIERDVVADFDGDGHADVISVRGFDDDFGFMLSRGLVDGRMRDTLHIGGTDVAAGDVDGDGRPDLVATTGGPDLELHRGGPLGWFEPVATLAGASTQDTRFLEVADIDGDGFDDVVSFAVDVFAAHSSNGDGTFAAPVVISTATDIQSTVDLEVGDVDLDGDLDVVTVERLETFGPSRLRVFVNDGVGVLSLSTSVTIDDLVADAVIMDADVDGRPDLVVSQGVSPASVEVFAQTPAGTFVSATSVPVLGALARPLVATDVDGDGDADLLLGASDAVFVIENGGAGASFPSAITSTPMPGFVRAIELSHIDADGTGDLVILAGATSGTVPAVVTLLGDGAGGYALGDVEPVSDVGSVNSTPVGDFDGDGSLDVFVTLVDDDGWLLRNTTGPDWTEVGPSLAGTAGGSGLIGTGALQAGGAVTLDVLRAPPFASTFLVVGFSELSAPLKGGVLVPSPDVVLDVGLTDGDGDLSLAAPWPAGIAPGFDVWFQAWTVDVGGFSATRGLNATAP